MKRGSSNENKVLNNNRLRTTTQISQIMTLFTTNGRICNRLISASIDNKYLSNKHRRKRCHTPGDNAQECMQCFFLLYPRIKCVVLVLPENVVLVTVLKLNLLMNPLLCSLVVRSSNLFNFKRNLLS